MASSAEYAGFIAELCGGAGEITYRKMFGEYGLYCGGKLFGTVEDNQFYVKITDASRALMPDAEIAEPHKGARYFLVTRTEEPEFLAELVKRMCGELPEPKPKKPKAPRGGK